MSEHVHVALEQGVLTVTLPGAARDEGFERIGIITVL